jgi:hypothetical protein
MRGLDVQADFVTGRVMRRIKLLPQSSTGSIANLRSNSV